MFNEMIQKHVELSFSIFPRHVKIIGPLQGGNAITQKSFVVLGDGL